MYFNMLYSVQMDIELYNYVDIMFHDYRGKGLPQKVQPDRFYNENQKNNRGVSLNLNSGVVFIPKSRAPPGMNFKRDNCDYMNNFFIYIVARNFTLIDQKIEDYKEANDDGGNKLILK